MAELYADCSEMYGRNVETLKLNISKLIDDGANPKSLLDEMREKYLTKVGINF